MKTSFIMIIIFILSLIICLDLVGDDNDYSPIPTEKMSVIEELKYIVYSDQNDREWLIDSSKTYNSYMDINDSIRLTRVIELDNNQLLNSNIEKYYAAKIYQHCGGTGMKDDLTYYLRTISLCDEILNSYTDEYISDSVPLQIYNKKMERFESFKGFLSELIKIDTIKENDSDKSILILNYPIKDKAADLKILAESQYQRKIEGKTELINFNISDDNNHLNNFNEKMKAKIIKSFKEKFPGIILSDKQLNELIKEFDNLFNNLKKGIMEDVKNNPGKYIKNKTVNIDSVITP